MADAKSLLKQIYTSHLKENPELFVGVELEFPIVNLSGQATDTSVTKALLAFLSQSEHMEIEKYDLDGNIIQIHHKLTDDCILFEVSYNLIEFAFGKANSIPEVDQRFQSYLKICQDFLGQHNHAIQGKGIHPQWQINDNSPVKTARYQMLMAFLNLSTSGAHPNLHVYPQYGSFICGNQVQLDVPRQELIGSLNLFNLIEPAKAYLFANSTFDGEDWDTAIARDIFWENSMHGLLPENIGLFPETFKTEEDFWEYLSQSAMFSVERDGNYFFFPPLSVADFLKTEQITVLDTDGQKHIIIPEEADLKQHRSYHYQDLTKRGTIEFRSVCAQPLEQTFTPTAFHLGLFVNLEALKSFVQKSDFLKAYPMTAKDRRRYFSRKQLSPKDQEAIHNFARELVAIAKEGLQKRGFGEEAYLQNLI